MFSGGPFPETPSPESRSDSPSPSINHGYVPGPLLCTIAKILNMFFKKFDYFVLIFLGLGNSCSFLRISPIID